MRDHWLFPSLRAGFAFPRIVVAVRWTTPPRHADPSLVDAPEDRPVAG
jgi:hypothetical protein